MFLKLKNFPFFPTLLRKKQILQMEKATYFLALWGAELSLLLLLFSQFRTQQRHEKLLHSPGQTLSLSLAVFLASWDTSAPRAVTPLDAEVEDEEWISPWEVPEKSLAEKGDIWRVCHPSLPHTQPHTEL